MIDRHIEREWDGGRGGGGELGITEYGGTTVVMGKVA